jgi:hypothetical protein
MRASVKPFRSQTKSNKNFEGLRRKAIKSQIKPHFHFHDHHFDFYLTVLWLLATIPAEKLNRYENQNEFEEYE